MSIFWSLHQGVVVAFVGRPHRLDDRSSQTLKALRDIGFDHYYQAEQTGWVLYLEGATDLAILQAFAETLDHPAREHLERPFVHYVANQPRKAQEHLYGLREARPELVGVAIYDRLDPEPPADPNLDQQMWRQREIENYLCSREALLLYAEKEGRKQVGELWAVGWRNAMSTALGQVEAALRTLGKDPWGKDYIYVYPGQKNPNSYDLYSAGPDGQPGTEDDIEK